MFGDFSTIACYAAVELDCHRLGKDFNHSYSAIEKLSSYIRKNLCEVKSEYEVDPTLALIMFDALGKYYNESMKKLEELCFRASLFVQELGNLKSFDKEKLHLLEKTCLDISKKASIEGYEDDVVFDREW